MGWSDAATKRTVLWLGLAVVACALSPLLPLPSVRELEQALRADPPATPSRSYQFVAADGRAVPRTILGAQPTAWIFGYTRCGAPCRTLLDRVDELASRLGGDADRINFVFVTVDPVQDTPEALRAFLSGHTPRLVALIGPPLTTRHMANRFRVSFPDDRPTGTPPSSADLTRIFLTDQTGKLAEAVELDEDLDTGITEFRRVIDPDNPSAPDRK